jgi:hypothetical protein
MPGFMNPMPGFGRGMGRGRGGRHGWRHQFHATGLPFWARGDVPGAVPLGPAPAEADEIRSLKNQTAHLEQTLEQLRSRIADLESEQATES